MRKFNVTGLCVPKLHYMTDISLKLEKIKSMVDEGMYFTINRARQYGKTTTLSALGKLLEKDYIIISISFEGLSDNSFSSADKFCSAFLRLAKDALEFSDVTQEYMDSWIDENVTDFDLLNRHIRKMCRDKSIVLMIDEVDKSSSNHIFLHFLAMLRGKYLMSMQDRDYTFHSVILAGISDIRNIKLLMIQKGIYQTQTGERLLNSPWNIAAKFDLDMSFSAYEISTMLASYESDHNLGIDINSLSKCIYDYTNGYPVLVSRICQCIDEELDRDWSWDGIKNAVKIILKEQSTLFDDLFKNLEASPELYSLIYDILVRGMFVSFHLDNPTIRLAAMYGIIMERNGKIAVSNRIFEIRIYNYFISKDELSPSKKITYVTENEVISNGKLNMCLCLEKFAKHYVATFHDNDIEFLEKNARQVFLTYLKPFINGKGFYHIESQLLDRRRMDIVVDYGEEQFILELKIWHGEKEHSEAYAQLAGYLDTVRNDTGYLLTFDFRKTKPKGFKAEWISFSGKRIFDVVL